MNEQQGIQVTGETIADKTVCVRVEFGRFGNSRKVSSSQVQVDADKKLIHVSKTLLESDELKAIWGLDSEVRGYLSSICLPFLKGIHLLPLQLVAPAEEKLREYKAQRFGLVEKFLEAYPALCEKAATRLRTLYNPSDYPSVESIGPYFCFEWQYVSFGTPGCLKGISAGLFEQEREKAAKQMQEASVEIQQVLRTALAELVQHLRDRLTDGDDGKPKRLHKSAVEKLSEFLGSFDLRNVTDDAELKEQVEKARRLIGGVDVEAIRDTDTLRAKLRDGMAEISTKLDVMIFEGGARKFRWEEEAA